MKGEEKKVNKAHGIIRRCQGLDYSFSFDKRQ